MLTVMDPELPIMAHARAEPERLPVKNSSSFRLGR